MLIQNTPPEFQLMQNPNTPSPDTRMVMMLDLPSPAAD